MGKRREYEDDDGRTIADMSGIGRESVWRRGQSSGQDGAFGRNGASPQRGTYPGRPAQEEPESRRASRPWEEEPSLSGEERRLYMLGALKAGLLIALAFIVGLGIVVLLLLLLWT